jgi:peroxin-19
MLDQFAPEPKAPSVSSGPGRPQPDATPTTEGISDEEFAKQLQAGMAELLGELESSPEMRAQFESMMKELDGAAASGETASPSSGPPPSAGPSKPSTSKDKAAAAGGKDAAEESFQAKIQQTMERMRVSGDNATAAAENSGSDDFIAEMIKAMQGTGLDGEAGEEDFSKMILGMMEQLTNKEILYEPMKELDDKFQPWLEKNEGKIGQEDLKRYREQQIYVREIVGKFEEKTYSDENAADREYIVERMQKVCFEVLFRFGAMLMCYRCKQLALHPQILWEIWQLRKKRSEHLKKAVHNNKELLISILSDITGRSFQIP